MSLKIEPSFSHTQSLGASAPAPSLRSRGIADFPSSLQAAEQEMSSSPSLIDGFLDGVSNAVSFIHRLLFPRSRADVVAACKNQVKSDLALVLANRSFEITERPSKMAVLIKINERVIATHLDNLNKSSLEAYKKEVLRKAGQALDDQAPRQGDDLTFSVMRTELNDEPWQLKTDKTWKSGVYDHKKRMLCVTGSDQHYLRRSVSDSYKSVARHISELCEGNPDNKDTELALLEFFLQST